MKSVDAPKIIQWPDKVLSKISEHISLDEMGTQKFQKSVLQLMNVNYKAGGLGLAAPQIGISKRFFIAKINGVFQLFINPKITQLSQQMILSYQGCLSINNGITMHPVKRNMRCCIEALNFRGQSFTKSLSGLSATIILHENDHLNGILINDGKEDGQRSPHSNF